MKKAIHLLLVLSLLSVAATTANAKVSKAKNAKSKQNSNVETVVQSDENVNEYVATAEAGTAVQSAEAAPSHDASLVDSTFTIYIHPFNFLVPYSHFWAGFWVPNGWTDYPSFNLTFEWKLYEMSSLMTMPHFVRVDRSDDDYKIYDIGLQESYRWYNLGGNRWRYLQLGVLFSHLHVETEKDGEFDGWLYGFMMNVGMKKILNGGEGFLGRFAIAVDVGLGYAFTSDFKGDRKGGYFKMDKGFTIDVNAAFGFMI